MAYVPKVPPWAPGDRILDAEMNNMEQAAQSREATYVVEANGHGDFTTIQAALNTGGVRYIVIKPGIYNEVVNVVGDDVHIIGYGARIKAFTFNDNNRVDIEGPTVLGAPSISAMSGNIYHGKISHCMIGEYTDPATYAVTSKFVNVALMHNAFWGTLGLNIIAASYQVAMFGNYIDGRMNIYGDNIYFASNRCATYYNFATDTNIENSVITMLLSVESTDVIVNNCHIIGVLQLNTDYITLTNSYVATITVAGSNAVIESNCILGIDVINSETVFRGNKVTGNLNLNGTHSNIQGNIIEIGGIITGAGSSNSIISGNSIMTMGTAINTTLGTGGNIIAGNTSQSGVYVISVSDLGSNNI